MRWQVEIGTVVHQVKLLNTVPFLKVEAEEEEFRSKLEVYAWKDLTKLLHQRQRLVPFQLSLYVLANELSSQSQSSSS